MADFSRLRQSLRKELRPIEKSLKRIEEEIVRATEIKSALELEKRELQQTASQLRTAKKSLEAGTQLRSQSLTSSERQQGKEEELHAVGFALIEKGSGLGRSDLEQIVTRELAKATGLNQSGSNLKLKDFLSPGVLVDTLRSKMSRPKETLELKVIGRAKMTHHPEAERDLGKTIQNIGNQLEAKQGKGAKLAAKNTQSQLNLSPKQSGGMSR